MVTFQWSSTIFHTVRFPLTSVIPTFSCPSKALTVAWMIVVPKNVVHNSNYTSMMCTEQPRVSTRRFQKTVHVLYEWFRKKECTLIELFAFHFYQIFYITQQLLQKIWIYIPFHFIWPLTSKRIFHLKQIIATFCPRRRKTFVFKAKQKTGWRYSIVIWMTSAEVPISTVYQSLTSPMSISKYYQHPHCRRTHVYGSWT